METYTIRQTAVLLGMSVRTIRDWITRGKLKAFKYPGSNMWRVSADEITRLTGRKIRDEK